MSRGNRSRPSSQPQGLTHLFKLALFIGKNVESLREVTNGLGVQACVVGEKGSVVLTLIVRRVRQLALLSWAR